MWFIVYIMGTCQFCLSLYWVFLHALVTVVGQNNTCSQKLLTCFGNSGLYICLFLVWLFILLQLCSQLRLSTEKMCNSPFWKVLFSRVLMQISLSCQSSLKILVSYSRLG